MDVNAITNSDNSVKECSSPNVSQANVTADNIKVLSVPNDKEDQANKSITFNSNIDKKKLNDAINKLNKFLEDEKTHAEYSVHKELGTIMMKIIKDDTKEVILEIPPKKILDMVAIMCEQAGLIDKKA